MLLSAVAIDNSGGECNIELPPRVRALTESGDPPRPAARAMRGVLDALQLVAAMHGAGVTIVPDPAKP